MIRVLIPLGMRSDKTIEDFIRRHLLMVRYGDSACLDRIRDAVVQHPSIRIEHPSQFNDIEVLNCCT